MEEGRVRKEGGSTACQRPGGQEEQEMQAETGCVERREQEGMVVRSQPRGAVEPGQS